MQFRSGGLIREGYVWYADQLQVLVKWGDGHSSSLRRAGDSFAVHRVTGRPPTALHLSSPCRLVGRRFDPSPLDLPPLLLPGLLRM